MSVKTRGIAEEGLAISIVEIREEGRIAWVNVPLDEVPALIEKLRSYLPQEQIGTPVDPPARRHGIGIFGWFGSRK